MHLLKCASALALCLLPTFSSAATVSLNPTEDGVVSENGDGIVFLPGGIDTTSGDALITHSGPFSRTAVFEFDLSSVMGLAVSSAQFILTQRATGLFGPLGAAVVELDGYGGDGVVDVNDLHPLFNSSLSADPPSTVLGSITPTVQGEQGTEWVFNLDPMQLFSLASGGLLTLRVITTDADEVAGLPVFMNESLTTDFSSAPGLQPGVAPQLNFTIAAVPLPATLPLLTFGLAGIALMRRHRKPAATA